MPSAEQMPEIIKVERIAPGGSGIGRLSTGELVFVESTAPGDEIEVATLERRKGIAHARVGRLLNAGPGRVVPFCPHAQQCGGCDFMHLSSDAQREAKLAILEDALRRVGDTPQGHVPIGFVPSDVSVGYRSRCSLHTNGNGEVGFLATRSNQLVVPAQCAVASPGINAALSALAQANAAARRALSFCERIELREAADEPRLIARLVPKPKAHLAAENYTPFFPLGTRVVVAGHPDEAQLVQRFRLPGSVEMVVPAAAFTQVNQVINQKLVSAVLDAVARHGVCTFLDGYAGAGNFTLPLLAHGLEGEAMDIHAPGVYCARSVARDRGWSFDGFQVGDARQLMTALVRAKRQFDLVLLDPPREGSKNVLQVALQLKPRLVVLVACDPVALARDLRALVSAGGQVEKLTVFDMFPHTHHFETLAEVAF
jgi:23S rRNA (uracil1939-C5)-methyltransferase